MRIFLAGATGVIGVRLVPLLLADGHVVAGMTRSPQKADQVRELGAEPVVCDVFDAGSTSMTPPGGRSSSWTRRAASWSSPSLRTDAGPADRGRPRQRLCKPGTAEGVASSHANTRPMTEHEASRTLVKSSPELWSECSDAASLARHLGQFGEIRITRLVPETAVAWEGDQVSGTVRLEPSGWGTRVILTARSAEAPAPEVLVQEPPAPEVLVQEPPAPEPSTDADPDPRPEPPPEVLPPAASAPAQAPGRRRLMARLARMLRVPEPRALVPSAPAPSEPPEPPAADAESQDLLAVVRVEPPVPRPAPRVDAPPEPAPVAPPPPVPEPPEPSEPEGAGRSPDPTAILTAALDSLGQAHHRPYSRA